MAGDAVGDGVPEGRESGGDSEMLEGLAVDAKRGFHGGMRTGRWVVTVV